MKRPEPLTGPQHRCLAAVIENLLENGAPPSVRVLTEVLGYAPKSTQAIKELLDKLATKGYVRRVKGIACGIHVLRDLDGRPVHLALVPDAAPAPTAHLNARSGTLPLATPPAEGAPLRRVAGASEE